MKRTIRSLLIQCAAVLCAASVRADVVHVTYQVSADGPVTDAIGRTRMLERKGGVVTVPADGSVRVVKGRNLCIYK